MYYPLHEPVPAYYLPVIPCFYPQPVYRDHQTGQDMLSSRVQYPEVDPTRFHQSAASFKQLMEVATVLLNKLSESKEFAGQIMDAAQRGDKKKVTQLIQSSGIKEKADIHFNPDAITIILYSGEEQAACCKLAMSLRWR
ncbi:hypothetical protein WMZ97_01450 [Lentibacillus sp. N15]|uniref:hypothetical protein n=1 Tax=Lentibacillus songyuanensis TaxID=3136161 RepID=UPI0031BB33E6